MKSKVLFYGVLSLFIGGSLYIGYLLIAPSSESTSPKKPLSTASEKNDTQESADLKDSRKNKFRSLDSKKVAKSIWTDNRLQDLQIQSLLKRTPEQMREVQRNMTELMQLYQNFDNAALKAKLADLIKAHPDVPEYEALAGDLAYDLGEFDEAQKHLERVTELLPSNFVARTMLGEVYAINGDSDAANQQFDTILDSDPGYQDALYGKIVVADMAGDTQEAIKDIEVRAKANPNNGNVQAAYAETLQAQMKYAEARKTIDDGLRKDPGNPSLYRVASKMEMTAGNYAKAREMAEKWMINENNPQMRNASRDMQLQTLLGENRWDDARTFVQKWVREEPENELAKIRADMLTGMEEHSE
ncbi:MAG: hypothetical protein COV44_05925 [Deltaproteobacteria bacterium CG11_big_fil_rev_8_21_14_0_20_45_16]|nr:MAG: hypothetical protein COV44_05925 [Deltaproteobacteria bacterium CG11_big_fil_rev_8_21_14_0_20_45_16]